MIWKQTPFLPLEAIVHRRHNPDDIPPEKRPITNPELLLTSLYFLQEMRRPIPDEEKTNLQELDEELVANLVRGRFLSGIIAEDEETAGTSEDAKGEDTPKMKKNNIRVPYINNQKGEMYQQSLQTDTNFRNLTRKRDFARL